MKNILVLVNLSAGAERIAKQALNIAKQCKANLLLCNVIESPVKKDLVLANTANTVWELEEKPFLTLQQLADKVNYEYNGDTKGYQPEIYCLGKTTFNSDNIKQIIIDNSVSMIITGIYHMLDMRPSGLLSTVNKANCPVLVIPDEAEVNSMDATAYLTDLRYCDLEVVRFLKGFNAKIYVTHVSSNGIPDMEDTYAQNLLSDNVAAKTVLRNIKGNNRKPDLEVITATANIQFITIENSKHSLLERFLTDSTSSHRNYHRLPLLIMPYLIWHRVS
jgi:hypothetical protein